MVSKVVGPGASLLTAIDARPRALMLFAGRHPTGWPGWRSRANRTRGREAVHAERHGSFGRTTAELAGPLAATGPSRVRSLGHHPLVVEADNA
jgi:hypothetical protein